MEFTYILSNSDRIVKATRCLDESTLWTSIEGNSSVEVELSSYTELSSEVEDDTVLVQNEDLETIATFDVKLRLDGYWEVDYVELNGTLLENLNLTKDLVTCITSNCEKIAETQTENDK